MGEWGIRIIHTGRAPPTLMSAGDYTAAVRGGDTNDNPGVMVPSESSYTSAARAPPSGCDRLRVGAGLSLPRPSVCKNRPIAPYLRSRPARRQYSASAGIP